MAILEEEVVRRICAVSRRERTIVGDGVDRHKGSRIRRISHGTDDDRLRVGRTREGLQYRVVHRGNICRPHEEAHLQRVVRLYIHLRQRHIRLIGSRRTATVRSPHHQGVLAGIAIAERFRIRLVVGVVGGRFPFSLERISVVPAEVLRVSILPVDSRPSLTRLKTGVVLRRDRSAVRDKGEGLGSRRSLVLLDLINDPVIVHSRLQVGQLVLRAVDGVAEELLTRRAIEHNDSIQLRITCVPSDVSRGRRDIRDTRTGRRKHRIPDRFHTQVIEIEETRCRLEEDDIFTLCSGQRQTHLLPITETIGIVVDVRIGGQIGVGIGDCIDDLQRAEISRVSQGTYYQRLAIAAAQPCGSGDFTASRSGRIGLVEISEATSVELDHHRVETDIEFRQDDV